MENLMEMEYVINGEKYLITATKVEEPKEADNTETVELDIPDKVICDFVEGEDNGLILVSVSNIPKGMKLPTWLDIIKEYGVILTD